MLNANKETVQNAQHPHMGRTPFMLVILINLFHTVANSLMNFVSCSFLGPIANCFFRLRPVKWDFEVNDAQCHFVFSI